MTRQTIKDGKNQNAVRDYIQNGTGSPMPANTSIYDAINNKEKHYYTSILYTTRFYSSDLESGTKIISATEKQAIEDYAITNDLSNSGIPEYIELTNIALRVIFGVSTLSVGAVLNYSVEFPDEVPITGQITAASVDDIVKTYNITISKENINNYAKKQCKIYLWKDTEGTGDTTINKIRIDIAYGVCGNVTTVFLKLNKQGLVQINGTLYNSSNATSSIVFASYAGKTTGAVMKSAIPHGTRLGSMPENGLFFNAKDKNNYALSGENALDLVYIHDLCFSVIQI